MVGKGIYGINILLRNSLIAHYFVFLLFLLYYWLPFITIFTTIIIISSWRRFWYNLRFRFCFTFWVCLFCLTSELATNNQLAHTIFLSHNNTGIRVIYNVYTVRAINNTPRRPAVSRRAECARLPEVIWEQAEDQYCQPNYSTGVSSVYAHRMHEAKWIIRCIHFWIQA